MILSTASVTRLLKHVFLCVESRITLPRVSNTWCLGAWIFERASILELYASRRSAFLHQLVASVGDREQWEGQVTGKQMEYFC